MRNTERGSRTAWSSVDGRYVAYRRTTGRLGIAMLLFMMLFSGLDYVLFPILGLIDLLPQGTAQDVGYEIYAMLVYALSFMLPVLLCRLITPKQERAPLPLGAVAPRKLGLLIPAAIAVVYCAALTNGYLVEALGLSAPATSYPVPDGSYPTHTAVLLYISVALVPAFCEEFLFRGLVMTHLLPYGKTVAVLGSAVLFGLMHGTGEQILYTTVAGIVLAYVAIESGSIWSSVLIHMFNNLLSVVDEVMSNRLAYRDEMLLYSAIEMLVIGGGMICLAILVIQKERRAKEERAPIYKSVEQGALRVGVPLAGGTLQGFFSPTMIIFFALSILEIVSGLIWNVWA